jgi:peptide/nickel transport system substrate-binding protein
MEHEPTGLGQLRGEILVGRLNRRSVLKRAAALGLSALVIAGLLAACGDDDEGPRATGLLPTRPTQPAALGPLILLPLPHTPLS